MLKWAWFMQKTKTACSKNHKCKDDADPPIEMRIWLGSLIEAKQKQQNAVLQRVFF